MFKLAESKEKLSKRMDFMTKESTKAGMVRASAEETIKRGERVSVQGLMNELLEKYLKGRS